jgi:hypothetical protein
MPNIIFVFMLSACCLVIETYPWTETWLEVLRKYSEHKKHPEDNDDE